MFSFEISNKTLLGQALRLPLNLIPRKWVVPILGGKGRGLKSCIEADLEFQVAAEGAT
jgi:hypothetical protein